MRNKFKGSVFWLYLVAMIFALNVLVSRSNQIKIEREQIDSGKLTIREDSPEIISTRWMGYLTKYGGQKGYKLAMEDIESANPGNRHQLMHMLGAALYTSSGIDGIKNCDFSHEFGCIHGFVSQALTAKGTGIIKDLDKACVKYFGDDATVCHHGMGHGILAYLGYDKLQESLSECENVTPGVYDRGCVSGVFMEYNFRTFPDKSHTSTLRRFDQLAPDVPCNILPSKYGPACYLSQAEWWMSVLDRDFIKVLSLCKKLQSETDKTFCVKGISNTISSSINFDPAKYQNQCEVLKEDWAIEICDKEVRSLTCYNSMIGQGHKNIAEIVKDCASHL